MANIAPLDRGDLPEFEPVFQIVESAMGFVPRSMFTMGRNPALLRAFGQMSFAVLGPGLIDDAGAFREPCAARQRRAGGRTRRGDLAVRLAQPLERLDGHRLEEEPLGFGREHLAAQGWDPGKHAHT